MFFISNKVPVSDLKSVKRFSVICALQVEGVQNAYNSILNGFKLLELTLGVVIWQASYPKC